MSHIAVETPLHPCAMHRHTFTGSKVYAGWGNDGQRYKVHVCACGKPFFFEPD